MLRYLPPQIQSALRRMPAVQLEQVQEIRLRVGRPAGISVGNRENFFSAEGVCTTDASNAVIVSQKEIEQSFQAVCEYSIYRYAREISEGFVTLAGGNRVGIAGTAVYRDGVLTQLRNISSLNFRVAHAVIGCADRLYGQTCGDVPRSLLLVGSVGAGKTTMLRDLCRQLGNVRRVTLVDERGEIAAMHRGVPRYDIGLHTDVLDGFSRAEGLMTALRVLTPETLICDEIGTAQDVDAILRVHGCGVPVIASAHGASVKELEQRSALRPLLEQGVFQYIAVLDEKRQGELKTLRRVVS